MPLALRLFPGAGSPETKRARVAGIVQRGQGRDRLRQLLPQDFADAALSSLAGT